MKGKYWKQFAFIASILVAGTLWLIVATSDTKSISKVESGTENNDIFRHIFSTMNYEEISSNTNEAKTINLGYGLDIHQCWCYGIKINNYDKEYDWKDTLVNNIRIIQNSETRNLIITDQENFVAFYDLEKQITFTQVVDGSSTLRCDEYSVYFWSNGDVDIIWTTQEDGTKAVSLRKGWISSESSETPVTLDEMIKLKEQFSSWLLVKTLGLGKYD